MRCLQRPRDRGQVAALAAPSRGGGGGGGDRPLPSVRAFRRVRSRMQGSAGRFCNGLPFLLVILASPAAPTPTGRNPSLDCCSGGPAVELSSLASHTGCSSRGGRPGLSRTMSRKASPFSSEHLMGFLCLLSTSTELGGPNCRYPGRHGRPR